LVVDESHELAERDTCYFTAASAAALAAVGAASAAVGAAIAAIAAAAMITVSVVATITLSIAAIYCCRFLVHCLAPVEGGGSGHHGQVG
jgi:spore maturation protein SpmA